MSLSQAAIDKFSEIYNSRNLNKSTIKDYALNCSMKFRAGKFTRVGSDFLEELEADVEAFIRAIGTKYSSGIHPPLYTQMGYEVPSFVTSNFMNRIHTRINETIARLIQEKVQQQPTVGKTLSRTR